MMPRHYSCRGSRYITLKSESSQKIPVKSKNSGQNSFNVLLAQCMKLPIDESKIPDGDKNSTVLLLLEIIRQQAEQIQQLKDEIGNFSKSSGKILKLLNIIRMVCYAHNA